MSRGLFEESIPIVIDPPRPDADTYAEREDPDLVRLSQQGDHDAFGELVQRYQRRAYWVSFHLVGDPDEARDIVQESFIRAYRSLARFDFQYRFYTWFYQIVTNLSIDSLRRRSRRPRVSFDDVGPVSTKDRGPYGRVAADELKSQVREVLETLPPKYKLVMVLRDIEGIESEEIARIINRTHSTVRWRLFKARQIFRENWEKRFPASGERAIGGEE